MAKVNLGYLEQALDGRIQVPFEAIQALDVIMRHLPSQKYVCQCSTSFQRTLDDYNIDIFYTQSPCYI